MRQFQATGIEELQPIALQHLHEVLQLALLQEEGGILIGDALPGGQKEVKAVQVAKKKSTLDTKA